MADPSKEQMTAREEVMKCEQEIQSIKAALRRLGPSEEDGEPNSMEIVLLKVEGLPEGAKPTVSLQLSNPIEEATLSEIFDPLNSDPAPEGSLVIFKGVETTLATLVVSAKDVDIPLGMSAPHDLVPLCVLDAMDIKDKYVTELPVAIVGEFESAAEVVAEEKEEKPDSEAVEESKVAEAEVVEEKDNADEAPKTEEGDAKEDAEAAGEATAEATTEVTVEATAEAVLIQPTCTLTLRVTYKPSPKDQREELYELLNKTSRRKATSLENLRKISMTMTRAASDSSPRKESSTALSKPPIKPGFLNKKKKEPTRMQRLYERTLGPASLLRKGWGAICFGKDYIIFFGAISFFHFKGQMLALPPPV